MKKVDSPQKKDVKKLTYAIKRNK